MGILPSRGHLKVPKRRADVIRGHWLISWLGKLQGVPRIPCDALSLEVCSEARENGSGTAESCSKLTKRHLILSQGRGTQVWWAPDRCPCSENVQLVTMMVTPEMAA